MPQEGFKRKLTAVFSADVAGYSRLMADDEAATVKTIATYREVMASLIKQHRGRVVDSPGDNVLAEFASVVDAVQCAVAAQKEFQSRNAALPENRRMEFRIGINLGDVIEEEDRIYGDGVNIAARLEALAEPGGICISKTSFDHIETKLPLGYEYLGEQEVKNIPKPVGAYKVVMEPRVTIADKIKKEKAPPVWRRKAILAGGVALILVVIPALIWNFYFRRPTVEPASVEKMAYPMPDKPSIAVLPFMNISGDPKQEYLADGITEDIIAALSRIPELFIIARNSTFTYKGNPVKVQQVAEELGVRYVLEGSLQHSRDRIRVTAQLIDAVRGYHIMSKRLETSMKEIFALQDDITKSVIAAIEVKFSGSSESTVTKGPSSLEAYLTYLEARGLVYRFTKDDNVLARRKIEEAITLDPGYSRAYGLLSTIYVMDMVYGVSPKESMIKALQAAEKAVAIDESNASAHLNLGFVYSWRKQHDKAIAENERAVELEPGASGMWFGLGRALDYACRHEEAVEMFKKAIRMGPLGNTAYYFHLGNAYFNVGRYEEGITAHKKALEFSPNNFAAHRGLTACYAQLGLHDEASFHAKELLKYSPKFSVAEYIRRAPWNDSALTERWANALRKAGLPETPPLPLPDKPSIAVLPFTNMSDDPKQEYFSDGITEEIITALSKTPKLFVIARNSTFTYKGKPTKVQKVGRELGVKYVLEGSVRKAGDKVRITAQLVDAQSGNHLWAERYDRDLKDIFAIQDEITKKVITALQVKLTEGEEAQLTAKGTDNLEAYLLCLQSKEQLQHWDKDGVIQARQLAEQVIALDPNYAEAYYMLAWSHWFEVPLLMTKDPRKSITRAMELAKKAIDLDGSLGCAHSQMGYMYILKKQYDEGIAECEQAVSLEPNSARAHYFLGAALKYAGRHEEAITMTKEAIRLDPMPPSHYYDNLTASYCSTRQYEEATIAGKKAVQIEPDSLISHAFLAAAYSLSGRQEEARFEAKEVLRIKPKFSVGRWTRNMPYKNEADRELLIAALRNAGLK